MKRQFDARPVSPPPLSKPQPRNNDYWKVIVPIKQVRCPNCGSYRNANETRCLNVACKESSLIKEGK